MIAESRRERYLSLSVSTRLGGLAADLARIASFTEAGANTAVEGLLEESTAFIEWSASDLPIDDAAELVDIQRGLAHWRRIWPDAQNDPAERLALASQAQAWSDRVLQMSGLLD